MLMMVGGGDAEEKKKKKEKTRMWCTAGGEFSDYMNKSHSTG